MKRIHYTMRIHTGEVLSLYTPPTARSWTDEEQLDFLYDFAEKVGGHITSFILET